MSTHLRHLPALLLSALALGVAFDLLFYQRLPGVSAPIMVALCLAALAALSRAEGLGAAPANRWVGPAALLFSALTAVRADPTLTALNALAALSLLLLQAGLFRGASLARLSPLALGLRWLLALAEALVRPAPAALGLALRARPRAPRLGALLPVARGLLIALPLLAVFTALLSAADSVFASYVDQLLALDLPLIPFDLAAHALLIGGVAWLCAGALLAALRPELEPEQPAPAPLGWLGCVEALTVLGLVALLFSAFMLVQAAYLFGGLETLSRSGMTFADYARRGFFELVAVACLAIGMLWGLATITRRGDGWQTPAFNAACALLIALVLGLLASAFYRMWLYEQAYGFTHLRLYTHVFMAWLAVVLLLLLAALLAARPQLMSFGSLASALLALALLTLANPEAIIVQANVARYQATGQLSVGGDADELLPDADGSYRPSRTLDASYLSNLSTDATPTLVALLPSLDAEAQAQIEARLREQRDWLAQTDREGGWPSWHLSRASALWALEGR